MARHQSHARLVIFRTLFLAVYIGVLVFLASCEAPGTATMNDAVRLKITKTQPSPPLDPYQQFAFSFEIQNGTDVPILVPDLNRLELEIRDDDGTMEIRRFLKRPLSVDAIKRLARAKAGPHSPLPLTIDPRSTHEGLFPSLDAMAPLPAGEMKARLRVGLENDGVLESESFEVQVARLQASFEQEVAHEKAVFTDTMLRQKLLLFGEGRKSRLVMLSSIYPDFLSVVADCRVPKRTERVSLLHYWPPGDIRLLIAVIKHDQVDIFRVDKQSPETVNELTLRDVLPLRKDSEFVGLVFVSLDERSIGADDYLLLTVRTDGGSPALVAEYWKRDRKERLWYRSEVERHPVPENRGNPRMSLCQEGFEVFFDDTASPYLMPLLAQLGQYRQEAATDSAPIKDKVSRK